MILPNYESGSIVNLISSILKYYNAQKTQSWHYDYQPLSNYTLPEHRRLVLIAIDGLGLNFLENLGKHTQLYKHTKTQLTSVFPSTTAAALTSLITGQAPLQHGLTGWFMYFKELGTASLPLPFSPRFTDKSFDSFDININDVFNFDTIFKQINKSMLIVSPEQTINSAFSYYCFNDKEKKGYTNIDDCFNIMKNQLSSHPETEIIYSYIPHFDEVAHHYGINSAQAVDMLNYIDNLYSELINTDGDNETLFIITADHGLIDTTPDKILRIADYPAIQECLILPLCGEPRVPYCYIRPSKKEQFEHAVNDHLSPFCDRYTLNDVLSRPLYGLGKRNPKLADRIGDEILIMKENYILTDNILNEKNKDFIGFHGGLTKDEMLVPLISYLS
ncbi:MAG: alkaline phosphatase family protein [Candidatus Cloacimonetes bacterium]|nr:alkaline phosphatase family protein [Candidatus Cloacimonadota bacterium]MDD4156174.1 alkaline phosphatase family protein [Candidatus Cloacimonadota bacterium]